MTIADRVSAFNRKRKYKRFMREFSITEDIKILDLGFTDKEYTENDNFLEKHYPYPRNISALGIDSGEEFANRYPEIKVFHYDGKKFPFADRSFDIVWSNAVIEHVGGQEEQVNFLKEALRVGKSAFITTPNRLFPIEVHTRTLFLHWLPKKIFDFYLKIIGKSWAGGEYMNLLSKKDIKNMLADIGVKDYEIISNRILGFAMDFVIIIKK